MSLLSCLAGRPAAAADSSELNNRGVEAAKAGRFEEAAGLLRQALAADPADATARKNLSGILLDWAREREPSAPVEELITLAQEAVALEPGNGPAWAQLGEWRYFRQGDFAGAIDAWQRAAAVAPAEIARALADRITRAQRDQVIERGYAAAATAHFDVRFEQASSGGLEALTHLLEESYAVLAKEFGSAPPRLTVIIYAGRELHRVATQRDWAIGLYDGRLRLRVDELTAPLLSDLIRHELTHAFLQFRFGHRVPVWAHEGYAQLQESTRPVAPEVARIEDGLRSRASWIPLRWLDRRFRQPSGSDDILRAYAESRLIVKALVERHGRKAFHAFLAEVRQGAAVEAAFDRTFAPSRWSRADLGIFE
ncbi:MAG: hypothetical protein HY598_01190 [Candidatus Omnitrophica bacterium]|nr:hypothetical protein [Candidatus Omnitrophota bacterium]